MTIGSGDIARICVRDDKVRWETQHEWYDPPEYTDENVEETDSNDM